MILCNICINIIQHTCRKRGRKDKRGGGFGGKQERLEQYANSLRNTTLSNIAAEVGQRPPEPPSQLQKELVCPHFDLVLVAVSAVTDTVVICDSSHRRGR